MRKPAKVKLTILQGATFRKRLTWRTRPAPAGVAIDLTGCTARMHVRTRLGDPLPFLILTTENGRIALGGVTGTVDLFISDADTTAIQQNGGVYDLEIQHPNGDVTRLAEGSVTVSKEVTRA